MYKILVTTTCRGDTFSGVSVSVHTVVVEFHTIDEAMGAVHAVNKDKSPGAGVRQFATPLF